MRTDTPFAAPLTADQALETVGAALAGCPADAVEVTLLSRTAEYTRFAGDRIHQPQDITELTVSIKAVVDGHAARASTSSLARIGDTARLAARLAAQRARAATGSGHALLARPEAVPDLRLWHEDTVAFDAARARRARGPGHEGGPGGGRSQHRHVRPGHHPDRGRQQRRRAPARAGDGGQRRPDRDRRRRHRALDRPAPVGRRPGDARQHRVRGPAGGRRSRSRADARR